MTMLASTYRFTGSRCAVTIAGATAVILDMALYRLFWTKPEAYSLLARAISVLLILCLLLLSGRASTATLGLSKFGLADHSRWIVKLCALVLAGYLILSLAFVAACRIGLVDPAPLLELRDFTNIDEFHRYLLVGLIVAPIFEELVYRSLAVPAFAGWLGNGWAILLSGPLFYFLHIVIYARPWFLFHYVLAGWILAWAFVRTGNVWSPMILHALGNVLMGLAQALLLAAPGLMRWVLGEHP